MGCGVRATLGDRRALATPRSGKSRRPQASRPKWGWWPSGATRGCGFFGASTRCPPVSGCVVYVDSGSTDDSVAQARLRGFEVVELDTSIPFTAARARNAGLRRLEDRWPELAFVQLVDGDCALAPGWMEAAVAELESNRRLAVVCGRRREVNPGASVYNRLSDMEWNTPVGDAPACGGDALARLSALREVGGYDERLIAGEEPEMCARLRAREWGIRRIAHEMTLHDAAMTRFGQWWRRSVRSGYGFAEGAARRPPMWQRESRSCVIWGLVLPGLASSPPRSPGEPAFSSSEPIPRWRCASPGTGAHAETRCATRPSTRASASWASSPSWPAPPGTGGTPGVGTGAASSSTSKASPGDIFLRSVTLVVPSL